MADNISIDKIKEHLGEDVVNAVKKYFPPKRVNEALSVIYFESNGDSTAINEKGNSAGKDHGLFQINDYYHPEINDIDPYDIEQNVKLAADIWKNRGWKEWSDNTISKVKTIIPTINETKPTVNNIKSVKSNDIIMSKKEFIYNKLKELGVPTTDNEGKELPYSKVLEYYTASLGANKDLARRSAKSYPNEEAYFSELFGYKDNNKVITNNGTIGNNNNKSSLQEAYNRNYGITPDLGDIPSFVPQYLGDIPSGTNNVPEAPKMPSHASSMLNITPGELTIDDTLDITDSPVKQKPTTGDYASLLRFAPAVGSLYNMLDKDKPYNINLQRIGASERLTPERVNEMMLNSELASAYNSAVGNIINTSGGNASTARANVQAAGIGNAKAKADAFSKINMFNIQNKLAADQFNIQNANAINQGNVGISNQEDIINMQNKLAAEAKKEADRAAFFNSLGQVGVEQFYSNITNSANSGYGTDIYGKSKYKKTN